MRVISSRISGAMKIISTRGMDFLAEIRGIGRQTAAQIMSMIIEISRFPDAEKLCAYFGIVPRIRDPRGKERHSDMSKNRNRMMHSRVERVTESHMRNCESLITEYFRRLQLRMGTKRLS